MRTENLDYRDEQGAAYVGYLARPDQPNGAAVLIAHGAPGLSDHERQTAERLAGLGFVAFAADYHGKGEILVSPALEARVGPLMQDTRALRAPMRAALAALAAQDGVDPNRIAAIGYCMGGAAVFELACAGAEVKAVIGFHSLLPTQHPEDFTAIKGAVLMLQGSNDPYAPQDARLAFAKHMDAAGADWRIVLYGGVQHGFTMPEFGSQGRPGIVYHERADKRSWRAMLDALGEV